MLYRLHQEKKLPLWSETKLLLWQGKKKKREIVEYLHSYHPFRILTKLRMRSWGWIQLEWGRGKGGFQYSNRYYPTSGQTNSNLTNPGPQQVLGARARGRVSDRRCRTENKTTRKGMPYPMLVKEKSSSQYQVYLKTPLNFKFFAQYYFD